MRLNQATDYAFRMVLYLAICPEGTKITGAALAAKQNIPERFLLKIMRSLTAAGIMKSYRGVEGGFALQREPKDITLSTSSMRLKDRRNCSAVFPTRMHVRAAAAACVLSMRPLKAYSAIWLRAFSPLTLPTWPYRKRNSPKKNRISLKMRKKE